MKVLRIAVGAGRLGAMETRRRHGARGYGDTEAIRIANYSTAGWFFVSTCPRGQTGPFGVVPLRANHLRRSAFLPLPLSCLSRMLFMLVILLFLLLHVLLRFGLLALPAGFLLVLLGVLLAFTFVGFIGFILALLFFGLPVLTCLSFPSLVSDGGRATQVPQSPRQCPAGPRTYSPLESSRQTLPHSRAGQSFWQEVQRVTKDRTSSS